MQDVPEDMLKLHTDLLECEFCQTCLSGPGIPHPPEDGIDEHNWLSP